MSLPHVWTLTPRFVSLYLLICLTLATWPQKMHSNAIDAGQEQQIYVQEK